MTTEQLPRRRRRVGIIESSSEEPTSPSHNENGKLGGKRKNGSQFRRAAFVTIALVVVTVELLVEREKTRPLHVPTAKTTLSLRQTQAPKAWTVDLTDAGPDYGGLRIDHTSKQPISSEEMDRQYRHERRAFLIEIDGSVDEDWLPDEDLSSDYHLEPCRRNNWEMRLFTNCNLFHEHALERFAEQHRAELRHDDFKVEYLGHGSYRDTWLVHDGSTAEKDTGFIWKCMILNKPKLGFDHKRFGQIQIDAIVMERLTSSKRIPDIYGHCGTSIIQEQLVDELESDLLGGRSGNWRFEEGDDRRQYIPPQNNLTLNQKLDMAIAFAESLAEIHGFAGGAMMHADFHSPQWLYSLDGVLKLNDFNKGFVFKYNEKQQEYCPIRLCKTGSYRSPEEQRCVHDGTEKADVFALGNNFYVLLTGLWPHYEYQGRAKHKYKDIGAGTILPFIHDNYRNRSAIETTLIRLMEACWVHDPKKRISSFAVLKQLYDLRDKLLKKAS